MCVNRNWQPAGVATTRLCGRQTEPPKVQRTVCGRTHVGTSSSARWLLRGAVFTQDFLGECKGSLCPPGTHCYEALPTSGKQGWFSQGQSSPLSLRTCASGHHSWMALFFQLEPGGPACLLTSPPATLELSVLLWAPELNPHSVTQKV